MSDAKQTLTTLMKNVETTNPNEPEFLQAVKELGDTLLPLWEKRPELLNTLRVMSEPERVISFRVIWEDDKGELHMNKGYRVQFNSCIGPYKGGLRFHPTVNLSVLKFLGFEQTIKNALTTLPIGGGKGGSNFNPKGRSDKEIMRFCQAFMLGLHRHIGSNVDVPAGDIGVGGREIGYLYGAYKQLANVTTPGVLTGKPKECGGSNIRPEATGRGVVYLTKFYLDKVGKEMAGKSCIISGSGNVAQYTLHTLLHYKAKVLTLSDSSGYIYDPEGITAKGLEFVQNLKNVKRGRISEYLTFNPKATYVAKSVWDGEFKEADFAFPCATQNEINLAQATTLINNGISLLAEGANMPCSIAAITAFQAAKVAFLPAKAANAGGVAVSALEMSQNSLRMSWSSDEVDEKLQGIMKSILQQIWDASEMLGSPGDLVLGANAAGFLKVAAAMKQQGLVY